MGELYSPELMRSVASKLPITLRYAYNRYAAGDVDIRTAKKSALEKLSEFLNEEADLALASGIFDTEAEPSPTGSSKKSVGADDRKIRKAAVTAIAGEQNEKPREAKTPTECWGCEKPGHRIGSCDKFRELTTRERRARASDKHLCFICLAKGHLAANCNRERPCRHCSGRHHSLLHQSRDENRRNGQGSRKEQVAVLEVHEKSD